LRIEPRGKKEKICGPTADTTSIDRLGLVLLFMVEAHCLVALEGDDL